MTTNLFLHLSFGDGVNEAFIARLSEFVSKSGGVVTSASSTEKVITATVVEGKEVFGSPVTLAPVTERKPRKVRVMTDEQKAAFRARVVAARNAKRIAAGLEPVKTTDVVETPKESSKKSTKALNPQNPEDAKKIKAHLAKRSVTSVAVPAK
jgi:hypothetical protein